MTDQKEFKPFSRLPKELRMLIWIHAQDLFPRIFEVMTGTKREHRHESPNGLFYAVLPSAGPALMQVNKESRSTLAIYYKPQFTAKLNGQPLKPNPQASELNPQPSDETDPRMKIEDLLFNFRTDALLIGRTFTCMDDADTPSMDEILKLAFGDNKIEVQNSLRTLLIDENSCKRFCSGKPYDKSDARKSFPSLQKFVLLQRLGAHRVMGFSKNPEQDTIMRLEDCTIYDLEDESDERGLAELKPSDIYYRYIRRERICRISRGA
ncbi:hypothetical protein GLAREA_02532 [Glarea lozoyensis ATCC 20868]|uniref:2EXR domain-containing protein n=1 Tax=Glarea lozoyensis (strain ATCC 20868 / MF5171) TaxID=1116229 RepID=S3CN41_GLAL2|nr:uncharacterized protein GLAREA_02532 [Glarea lozoyensis ATCC 20868]EPE26619.1 hypothetical protein GLAREA_02532 [Glarea lozoyensis ATCC 20868]